MSNQMERRLVKLEREMLGREGVGADRVVAIERYLVSPGLKDRELAYRRDLVSGELIRGSAS
jgi:hypothetical protein